MAKNSGPKLLHRVCYRDMTDPKNPVVHMGLWMENWKACNRIRSEMLSLYGEDNARIETIDKKTGRPVFESDDDEAEEVY